MIPSNHWRDPASSPLSDLELDRVFDIQCDLRMVKHCESCGVKKPVETFGGFGMAYCPACEPTLYNACVCGFVKLRYMPRCRQCHRKLRTAEVRLNRVA